MKRSATHDGARTGAPPQHTGTVSVSGRSRRGWARRGGLLLLVPGLLSAAETQLPAVAVEASAPDPSPVGPDDGYQAQRSATATKTDAPLAETAQSISVVTRQRIEDQGASNLQDALNYVAGVRSDAYGLDSRTDSVRIRGAYPTEYLDGLRRQLSGFYTSNTRVDPYLLERIEVLRGPAAMLYGQGTTGGLLNMIAKRPLPETRREIGVQFGSFGRRQVHTDLTGALDDDATWLYRLVALGRDADTQVDHVDDDRLLLAPSLTWEPSADTSVTFQALRQRDRSGSTAQFFPWEGTVGPNPNGHIPTDRFIGDPDDRYDSDRSEAGVLLSHRFSEALTLRHVTRHSQNDVEYFSLYADAFSNPGDSYLDPDRRVLGRFGYFEDRRSKVWGSDTHLEYRFATGPLQHQVLLGADYARHRSDAASAFDFPVGLGGGVPNIDVFDPQPAPYTPPPLADEPRSTLRHLGVYAQDRLSWGPWIATGGVRRDRVRNALQGVDTERDQATSTSASLMYRFDGGLAPYVAYNESFTPVSGTSLAGERFRPLEGEQVEVGFKFQPPGADWAFNAAFYELQEVNQLIPDPGNPLNTVQTGKIHNRGIELELVGRLFDWLDLAAHYNYIDPDPAIEQLPHHQGAVWASVPFALGALHGFRAGLGARHFSSYRDGAAPTTPSVTLFDGMLAWERGPWRYALHGQNLADDTYVAACLGRGDCFYGARRSVYVTLSYRFQ
jgi:iron complex outermembrane recepter protein